MEDPPDASATRLKVPIDAPVFVVALKVTMSGELTLPIVRTTVTRIVVLPPVWRVEASGATNTRSGYAAVNCADVPAVTPSTVAVTRASPTVVLLIVARAVLLPSASMAAGVTVPSVVLNATSRRPDGRLEATVAVTRIVDMPSAGADPLVLTVTTSDGFADVKFTVNSNGRSYAVTRTRADPTVLSLCSSTVALPVASATTLTERPLPCPVAMRVPAEVSNLNVRCCVVPPGRFSIAVIAAVEKPSAGMDVRSTATSKTSDCLSAKNAIWKSSTASSAVMRTYAVPGESL